MGTLSLPSAAHANVMWPALLFEPHLLSWPAIVTGLIVEILALRVIFGLSNVRALMAGVTVNVISALLGIVLIPLAGVVWEIFPGLIIHRLTGTGTFNPATWIATFVLALAITTAIGGLGLVKIFKLGFGRKQWGLWTLANAISVAVAIVSLVTVGGEKILMIL